MIDLARIKPSLLWYLVGLITTDGCLSKDGRHINITSKDKGYLEELVEALGLNNRITMKSRGSGSEKSYAVLQFGDVRFYKFLVGLGLSQRKSLKLKKVSVPGSYFADFLRGVIDGDGNIRCWKHPQNGREQWELRIYSGARIFITWLQTEINRCFSARGAIISYTLADKNPIYVLKFGKMAARQIFANCYDNPVLCLERKHRLAKECLASYIGWTSSLTIGK